LESSQQFSFYRVGLLAPRPTPIPEDRASVFISPRGRMATHFSRLLRHAWVTVGLFLFPGHHTSTPQYAFMAWRVGTTLPYLYLLRETLRLHVVLRGTCVLPESVLGSVGVYCITSGVKVSFCILTGFILTVIS
jgi:hypothetical protein